MKQVLHGDLLKLKRSSLFIVVFLVPLVVLAYELLNLIYRGEYVQKQAEIFKASSMWQYMLFDNSMLFGLGFPLSVTIIASIIANIEHQTNSWKQTLSLPISKVRVYLSKYIWLFNSLLLTAAIFAIGMVVLGKALGFEGPVPWGLLFGDSFAMLLTALPVMSFQLWLSITFKNQAFSILIGTISSIVGLFLAAGMTTRWFPLAYPSQSSTVILQYEGLGGNPDLSAFVVINVFVGMALLFMGAFHFKKRDVL
ncbi:MrsG [Bacillus glycinifermentans]|uniref:ABC transporter permease n=1 Tax=Bacillus glycinifermentans TaxID=1664069 RepID=A0A0J6EQK9_9BACI|nr:ABC transporter permease [Bacillus glycinifermentans]ATH93769.1 MrsG [Bacillus glycinifermentans]KMM59530.1 MrsG [Bacillus glycinifermentans]KRT90054.1 MrsG [Bacillus glycinifermentans]MEC0483736.1 ABC transporter permease [Bacillus glycinifermentans]MEC0496231.1 ABC transporter permease [Bacillus glycinifermentans]